MSYTGTEVFERAIVVLDELSDTSEVECIDRCHLASRYQAEQAVSKYMLYYNRRRIHASPDYLSPAEFEDLLSVSPSAS